MDDVTSRRIESFDPCEQCFPDNVFTALASWQSAAHIEAAPKKKVPPTPPTP